MADTGDKTEKATPKRRKDERKKGNVVSSNDVTAVVTLAIVFFAVKFFIGYVVVELQHLVEYAFLLLLEVEEINGNSMYTPIFQIVETIVICVFPIGFVAMLAGIVGAGAQTKFLFSADLLKPKFSRLNPIEGIKRLFSLRSIVELLKAIMKIVALGVIVYLVLGDFLAELPSLFYVTLKEAGAWVGNVIMEIVKNALYFFIAIAVVDFGYQYYEYEKNIRMSKQEIKEEYKQMEGDPQVKGQIKERQRAMSQRRMMQDVPKSDVIIRNPTHYAVALRYKQGEDRAPKVLAKGKDLIALRIVEIAEKNDIIMVENVPLARGLYEAVELGMEIPEKFYQACAEVLAYVYRIKREGRS